jgi:hypothetical protein
MSRLKTSQKQDPREIKKIAVGAYPNGDHTVLVYRDDDDQVQMLHLCGHHDLRKSPPSRKCRLWGEPNIEAENAVMVAAHAARVWNQLPSGKLPYGFSDPQGFFDERGVMVVSEDKIGLTCASLVLAIFHISGSALVEYSTWKPRADDVVAQFELKRELLANDPVHSTRAATQIGKVRYRPLEVVGAAVGRKLPMKATTARRWAKRLAALLERIKGA